MALQKTNYSEIQQDEIDALRSIYMDDFEEEESKVGAWNVGYSNRTWVPHGYLGLKIDACH